MTPERSVCALVAYDGTDFSGFQVQANAPHTIQGALEEGLGKLTGQANRVHGSGRTDAGVHAHGQVIAVTVEWKHSLFALCQAWNRFLPEAIVIRKIVEAPSGFHPRFSATLRTYRYTVYHPAGDALENVQRFPLLARFAWVEKQRLDVEEMNRAARLLIGEHDFATFGLPTQGDSTVRRIEELKWTAEDGVVRLDMPHLQRLILTVTANGFLRRMARNLTGTLLAVGRGQWQMEDVASALAAQDRSRSAPPVVPNGLVLERVTYSDYPHLFLEE
ncbi:MAG: tRNA pseudouridine(38-40) synthase TruA [Caldilineaceae bacterium]|nr:tRNA pseudouridine(38-40) synthase TruA [Caldilineaceae bacterium]HRJ42239.1 tRNA pseudouridine(38-40) synthase TruA [Caldilineaceae bacterium]